MLAVSMLAGVGVIDAAVYEEIDTIRRIRDAVTHGVTDFKKSITPALIQRVEDVTLQLAAAGRMTEAERQERITKFMSGPYRAQTPVRPANDNEPDVDVVSGAAGQKRGKQP